MIFISRFLSFGMILCSLSVSQEILAKTHSQKNHQKSDLKNEFKKGSWNILNPRIYMPRPGSKATAGYFELSNQSSADLTLTVSEVQPFARVETHETVKENEQVKMIQVDQFSLAPKETLQLVPGGKHIMLFEPQKPLQLGQTLRGKLKIQNQIVEVDFKVVDRAQDQIQGQHQHH